MEHIETTCYITLTYEDENTTEIANNFEMNDKKSTCAYQRLSVKAKAKLRKYNISP